MVSLARREFQTRPISGGNLFIPSKHYKYVVLDTKMSEVVCEARLHVRSKQTATITNQ